MNGSGVAGLAAVGAAAAMAAMAQGGLNPPAGPPAPSAGPGDAAPPACLQRFAVTGLPYDRAGDGDLPEGKTRTLVCRLPGAVSCNPLTRNPDWAIERLHRGDLVGAANRDRSRFQRDPLCPASPGPGDYHAAYDRGHQAPAGDAKSSQAAMDQTFFMSNMAPQVGIGFNRGQWRYLEEAVRAWVLCGGHEDVVVVTGPIYTKDSPFTAAKIRVPARFFKIVYDVQSERAVGFELENRAYEKTDLAKFIVPISQIEDDTGFDFFHAMTRRRQTQLESAKGLAWGHDQACKGADTD